MILNKLPAVSEIYRNPSRLQR